jgi:hypothetical protein
MPALTRHPDTPCTAVAAIGVEVSRPEPGSLRILYRLSGVTEDLVMPPAVAGRADELWRHTCFEAFVGAPPDAGYRELNLAIGQWAAYRFDGYRSGMADADIRPPDTHLHGDGPGTFTYGVTWELDLPQDRPWRVGVSVVIEETGGRISYWALAHPPGKPDFHHADCFALQLPPPDRP